MPQRKKGKKQKPKAGKIAALPKKTNGTKYSGVSGGYQGNGGYKRCYEEHPTLTLGNGKLHGGSCHYPAKDYDIYIGLDHGMEMQFAKYPWHKDDSEQIEFLFKITDMQAPHCEVEFKNLINYMEEQLNAGKKIHVGCIGGHGRTGTVFAALVKQMLGEEDAITWVRKHYCKKAVESASQVQFLHKHYGITKVDASKSWGTSLYDKGAGGSFGYKGTGGLAKSYTGAGKYGTGYKPPASKVTTIKHVKNPNRIWA
jgi:hypothetical protein